MSSAAPKDIISVVTIDIGEKNFTVAKSEISLSAVKALKASNVPESKRYDKNREALPSFAKLLRKLSVLGKCVFVDKVDLTRKEDKRYGKRLIITNRVLVRLTNYLEDLSEAKVLDDVDYFVIEEQMKTVRTAANNRELMYHTRSYLIQLFLNFVPIILFPSKHKTLVLGAPKMVYNEKKDETVKMSYTQRKAWASERAFQILTDRGDLTNLSCIFDKKGKKKAKPDDICDCLLHFEAFIYLVFIDGKTGILDC